MTHHEIITARTKDRHEASIAKIGKKAQEYLDLLHEQTEDIISSDPA